MKIIQRGAEAVLYINEEGLLVKERVQKGYRVPKLDQSIRSQRTRRESGLMSKARSAGVSVPNIRFVGDFQIRMDYIDGEKVKNVLNTVKSDKRCRICEGIGAIAAKLHEANIIHGDLTTSNIIIRNNDLYLIDFGLGKVSHKTEDKAVDMFLLYEALKSTHFRVLDECWRNILKIYVQEYSEAKAVIERMEVIKRRRRYK